MDKQENIVLEGIFQKFDTVNRGRPYYTEKEYAKHLRHLRLQNRQRKIQKIISGFK